MRIFPFFAVVVLAVACTSKQDKMLAQLAPADKQIDAMMAYDKFVDSIKVVAKELSALNSNEVLMGELEIRKQMAFAGLAAIPDSISKTMHDFGLEFPAHPRSEYYLYASTIMAEKNARFFETAKWCEDYIKTFPKGRFRKDAFTAAAHNYEKTGSFNKAIEFYDSVAVNYPKTELGKGAKRIAGMLRKGLVTEEEQLQYLIEHPDTAEMKH